MLPETIEEEEKERKKSKKYLQEGRKVKERKCERGPVPRPPGCRKKKENGCAIAALCVVVINVIGKVS